METNSPNSVQEDLKELLKRCPAGTYEAALAFRQDKDVSQIETIVMGVIDRHLEPSNVKSCPKATTACACTRIWAWIR